MNASFAPCGGGGRICLNAAKKLGGAAYNMPRLSLPQAKEETRGHDVTDRRRRGLRSASCRSSFDEPVALSQRLLARSGDDARHDRSGLAILSPKFADFGAAGLAPRAGQAGFESRRHEGAGARSVRRQLCDLQSALWLADGVF